MAILGNKNNLIDKDLEEKEEYTIPATIKNDDEKEMSLKKSILISAILHPTVVGIVWLFIFVLALMGITLSIFERPKPKLNDIEFVLVDNAREQTPVNKNTRNRSDRNTRTGGKTNPKKKVAMPSPTPVKKSVRQSPHPKVRKRTIKRVKPKRHIFKHSKRTKPKPPTARPSIKPPSIPKLSQKPRSPFVIPVAKPKHITGKTYSTGPIGGHETNKSTKSSSRRRSSSYAPIPSLAPTSSRSSSSSSRMSRRTSGYSSPGNPGGGKGVPGIDSIREPDFGPYMRDLQRRIKMNWDPPKGNASKRVVLLFKIARDGRLLSARVFKSSGIPNSDRAAINAVELTAPFRPLPAAFRGSSIDIQFTFDYNVFGASGYN